MAARTQQRSSCRASCAGGGGGPSLRPRGPTAESLRPAKPRPGPGGHAGTVREDRGRWEEMESLGSMLESWRAVTSPVVLGAELLPPRSSSGPVLFVGNHSRFGFYDTPLFLHELYCQGFFPRSLALPSHWLTPLGPIFQHFGAIPATPRNTLALLDAAEHVLLYPGGVREVLKNKGEEYSLHWGDSPAFARMAAKTRAVVVPFAVVGADDAYALAVDSREILEGPAGPLLRQAIESIKIEGHTLSAEEAVQPVTFFPGTPIPIPFPVPSPNRLYIRFLPPLDLAAQPVDYRDRAACTELAKMLQHTVEDGLAGLLRLREEDPLRDLPARGLHFLSKALQGR